MNEIVIAFSWVAFDDKAGDRYFYGDRPPLGLSSKFAVPAVYRWALSSGTGTEAYELYFGETENLGRRLNGYLKPGPSQRTNLRLKKHFEDEIRSGARCELQLLRFAPFRVNGLLISESGLSLSPVRRMLENLLQATHDSTRCALLNQKENPIERRLRKALRANAETN